jgi:hypothetical protein
MTTPSSGLHLSKDLALYTTFIINIVAVFTLIALIVVIHIHQTNIVLSPFKGFYAKESHASVT